MKKLLLALSVSILLSSCAASYKSIKPEAVYYQTTENDDNVSFSYKYGVLAERGNKKYAKKETKRNIRIVSVKIVNNSGEDITIGQDTKIHANGSPVQLLDPQTIHSQLKQGVAPYLLYLLLTPMNFYTTSSDGTTDSTPIGLVVGPGLALGNIAVSSSANTNFKKELERYSIIGKTIKAGESAYGIIGIMDSGYSPLTIK